MNKLDQSTGTRRQSQRPRAMRRRTRLLFSTVATLAVAALVGGDALFAAPQAFGIQPAPATQAVLHTTQSAIATPQLQKYFAVAVGTHNSEVAEFDNTTLGSNGDWSGNIAVTNRTSTSLKSKQLNMWGDLGLVSRVTDPKTDVESTRFYASGQSSGVTAAPGSGYEQDVQGMDELNAELAALKAWISGLEAEATVTSAGTINVDQYDTNGDGYAVIRLNLGSNELDEETFTISGSGDVFPIFLMRDGTTFKVDESIIRLGGGLADATPPDELGALFVQLNSGSKIPFDLDAAKISQVGFYDLTLDPSKKSVIEAEESSGCGQLVGNMLKIKDSNFSRCSFGGFTPPAPPATDATITVRVSTDRIPGREGNATPLAGVKLRLAPNQANLVGWQNFDWAQCESDVNGDCTFQVPIRTDSTTNSGTAAGMRGDAKPWVVGVEASEGWSLLEEWGRPDGSSVDYRFRVDVDLAAGDTILSTDNTNFMRVGTGKNLRSFGQWPAIRNNPPQMESCGVDVAFVTDLSSSISAPQLVAAKTALDTTIDALTGTPSQVALFSFDGKSPATKGTNNPTLRPVVTTEQADLIRNEFHAWETGGGTNWDAGLYAAVAAEEHYELVIFLTDGVPGWYGTPGFEQGSSNYYGASLEAAIFSANKLKEQGTRVVTFGVGDQLNTGIIYRNLQAVSGTVEDSDYFIADDYEAAAAQLASYVSNCDAGVQVEKRVINEGETVPVDASAADLDAISAPAADWEIHAQAVATDGVQINGAVKSWNTNAEGRVNVPLRYTTKDGIGSVTITETQQVGHQIVPVDGKNLVCTNTLTDENVEVANAGTAASPGGKIETALDADITCVLYNQLVANGQVSWEKVDEQGETLAGSEWKLVGPIDTASPGAASEVTVIDCVADTAAECAEAEDTDHREGYFTVTGLTHGEYELVETVAPAGFLLDEEPHAFTVSAEEPEQDLKQIKNRLMTVPGLPLTGGLGEYAWLLAGLGLLIVSVGGIAIQQRVRGRGRTRQEM